MVRLVSPVVGLTFLSVVFKTSCLLCTEEYCFCFYKLYVIKFRSGFGGLSHHCLRDYSLWRQNSSFYYFMSYNEEFVWTFSLAPNKESLKPLGFLKYLYYTLDLAHRRLLRFSRVDAGHQKYTWANHIACLINNNTLVVRPWWRTLDKPGAMYGKTLKCSGRYKACWCARRTRARKLCITLYHCWNFIDLVGLICIFSNMTIHNYNVLLKDSIFLSSVSHSANFKTKKFLRTLHFTATWNVDGLKIEHL